MHVMNSNNNSSRQQRLAWLWAVPAFALSAMAVLALADGNVVLFHTLNDTLAHAGDAVWIHLSMIGDGKIAVLFILPFLGRRPDVVWQFVLALILVTLWVQGMKELFSHARPPAMLPLESFHLIGPALQNNAFPSGHTAAIFLLAGLFCVQAANHWLKFAVLSLAVMVGLSRIAIGVHWPMDVLGGALGGWLAAIGAVWLGRYWRAGLNVGAQRGFALFVTPFSVWAVWSLWHDYSDVYPGTDWLKVLMLITCLGMAVPGLKSLFHAK
jgi:membrane-associated phospholipid phosphatase